ncbi:tRNA (adenosine(37)-N6)-dimethylallyltransferase MiaA [Mucilaginibacter sp. 5C4]|uniref:tRNA (adenosine(37)-N6)-dimethylallyltransferase MiaA n=3 Tax=unclassified Mucilaginibacter TaxID=2617802 RepID=UPI002AC8B593|nr:tRNA (adenosine(37)-N6)-dimethylallyltransferase MiaA [Mucilaginibacter sp. 5C4]MEB0277567.1 tRNA (adenosine(37)-N6)-dimethylallyltransferase MiaA [Mucilaginibacter sp. 10B2]MEB0299482.1 tRNA (adenosine(37)-N6)-dimethylallyltransferase MiaA [Mucilaginibacter sp. 5C4]WPX24804.1 tRNA (adenosine(37)-N6)-dimethylallyltransferase MiaA [Mucilaginibacter sp. 5C4]
MAAIMILSTMNHEPLNNKTLIVIAGPTASGKTAAAISLAQHYNTVVVSADSRQFFREMSIGTAKPTDEELAAAPHYFINSHSITEPFSVGDFEREGMKLLTELFEKHDVVIMAGGSGLYIRAITEGFDELPTADPNIRDRLNTELATNGIAALQERLKKADPVYYAEVDISNPQRVIRALEVFEATGNPISSFRTAKTHKRPFNIIKFGLDMPREQLYDRINRRVDLMVKDGLLEEVAALKPFRRYNALNTVGYSELFDFFDGKTDMDTAIDKIKQNTRRFAKRQLTWFRKDKDIIWTIPNMMLTLLEH